ncbi:MAG: glutamate synthase subunit beta [Fusobacteriota bacterium]
MGKLGGFLEFGREEAKKRPVDKRVKDYKEIYKPFTPGYLHTQSARCMDCGTPFCSYTCPVDNLCPEWNDFVNKGEWKKALQVLEETNNFPEFTGRLCPALCEGGCVLGINDDPVTIKNIELSIAEKGWSEGWIKPHPPKIRTEKKIAVVGSGPAGLAAAQQLNRFGHNITVFEKDSHAGGILTFGIPDFKIEKWVVERRVNQIKKEGVSFIYNTEVGKDISVEKLKEDFDAVVMACGSREARDLPVYGRDLDGIHYAMDYLTQQNILNKGKSIKKDELIDAKGKSVVVIGGGDTGSDCVGTAVRQGAKEVYQVEILNKPPTERMHDNPWPKFPQTLKISTSHEEARVCLAGECKTDFRQWNILTKKFTGDDNGNVKKLHGIRVEWKEDENGKKELKEIPNTEFELDADLVILAIGFIHPEHDGLVNDLGLDLDNRGNIDTDKKMMSNIDGFFSAGDMRMGQSLIVHAIKEGRTVAESVDSYLMKD